MEVRLSPIEDLTLSRKGILNYIERESKYPFTESRQVFLNLLQSADIEISKLIKSIGELDYVSLHTRNIFELYLIMLHINTSDEMLKRWCGQQYKDTTDVRNGFRTLLINKGLDISELDNIQEFEDASLNESPYESERHFNIRYLAKTHGYINDYDFLYKLSSKLIHPSAMKVNNYQNLVKDGNYLTVVVQLAVFFAQKVEVFVKKLQAK